MHKVVIILFVMVVGAGLIGVPLYGFFNPQNAADLRMSGVTVEAATSPSTVANAYTGTTWTTSNNITVDNGYGQFVSAVFDITISFMPSGKMTVKSHIFSDSPLSPGLESMKPQIEEGWEGTWRISDDGRFIKFKIENRYLNIPELKPHTPFNFENFEIKGNTLEYNVQVGDKRLFQRLY